MQSEIPNKITILRGHSLNNSFSVITATGYPEKIDIAQELTFDEMLGYVARLTCPSFSDGCPIRSWGKPLFLDPPAPKHPDFAGDKAPPAFEGKLITDVDVAF